MLCYCRPPEPVRVRVAPRREASETLKEHPQQVASGEADRTQTQAEKAPDDPNQESCC